MYRDQLREVERDRARGVLAPPEAEAARAEVGRRLLAASERSRISAPTLANPVRSQTVTFAALLGIPALALGAYLALGSPELPGQPLAARMQTNPENEGGAALVARAEAELQRNPDNGAGWDVMAPVYMRLGRYGDAVRAYANAIRLSGSTADRELMHAIAQVAAADGLVTAQARGAIDRALALDPKHLQARISRALALEQDGDRAGAASVLKTVRADAPAGAPWAPGLQREIARLDGTPPRGPTAEQVEAAQSMGEGDRSAMIRGMVEGLAARLAAEGGGIDDWLKLVRSYKVIGETEKARQAAAQARERYAKDSDALAKIDSLVQSLGLGG